MKRRSFLLGLVCLLVVAAAVPVFGKKVAPRITPEELDSILASPGLVLLDVRTEKDWNRSDRKITGAVRVDPNDVDSWAGEYAGAKKIVLYCA